MLTSLDHRKTPADRLSSLRRILESKGYARIMEAHSGLSGIVAELAHYPNGSQDHGRVKEFDGIWESSLTDSGSKGLPDASIVGTESRVHTINEILQVTNKPLIVDGDTGGEIPQFEFLVTNLERIGVSAVIIEDKVYPKRNSLDGNADQTLETAEAFAAKIQAGKEVAISDDFMVIARIESLIAGVGLEDALNRAECYIEVGVDGVMIHSNQRDPQDLFAFVDAYNRLCQRMGRRPALVSVPTTYNQHTDKELADLGFNIIIHANHMLRASHHAMTVAANSILENDRSFESDEIISSVKEIFSAVGFDRITARDRAESAKLRLPVIIPAAGRDPVFSKQPKSLIKLGRRRIFDFQLEEVSKAGLKKVVVITGHEGQQYEEHYGGNSNISFIDNSDYDHTGPLHSLMHAKNHMAEGFVLVYSDILFDHEIINRLISSGKDIVLGIDNSFKYHQHEVHKLLDLVVTNKTFDGGWRSLNHAQPKEIARIGKKLDSNIADSEFIGMAYFSERAVAAIESICKDYSESNEKPFQEAPSFQSSAVTDMIQELLDQGFPVHGIDIYRGWREIHSEEDRINAESELIESTTTA